jgi:hypothetical protein
MRLTFPTLSAPPSRASTSSTGGKSVFCEFPSRLTPVAPLWTRKCDCPAHPRSISRAARYLTGFTHSGQGGSLMTSTHIRPCIVPAILRTVPYVTGKTRKVFPFALHSPRWGNVLEASTWRCCPLGAYCSSSESTRCLRPRADLTRCFSAYSPRAVMSTMHASPADAVRIFKDVKARKALAMHWG